MRSVSLQGHRSFGFKKRLFIDLKREYESMKESKISFFRNGSRKFRYNLRAIVVELPAGQPAHDIEMTLYRRRNDGVLTSCVGWVCIYSECFIDINLNMKK